MKLKTLLKEIPADHLQVKGSKEIEITGITSNSKLAGPKNLFIACKGRSQDGNQYIDDALQAGCNAIVTDIYNPFLTTITQIIHPNPREIEAELAKKFFGAPDEKLFICGVTGTNGKTTTSYLIHHLLNQLGKASGLISTIDTIIGPHLYKSTLTTPDVITNYKLLKEMCALGLTSAVLETSSHALDQNRVDTIDFDCAVFTNLSHEHLDYHKTMEDYFQAKLTLFTKIDQPGKIAIINIDDPYGKRIQQTLSQAALITYGIDNPADLRATHIQLNNEQIECTLSYKNQTAKLTSKLVGTYNIYNLLAAAALGLSQNYSLEQVVQGLKNFQGVSGRLEKVSGESDVNVYVDFAHTPDALKNALNALREIASKRLFVVFGCGGNRDKEKRSEMAKVSEALSDKAFITSDNPRTESPNSIIETIVSGFTPQANYHIEPQREEAIRQAIQEAEPGDTILIAGKGHETTQIEAMGAREFSDQNIARAHLTNLFDLMN